MKKIKQHLSLIALKISIILLMLSIFTSCGKDGAIGPKGDTGIQGNAGAQGAQGIPGKDGAVILTGTGTPPTATGNNGDMYLDKSTGNLYGPKSAGGWGTPLNLKGEAGQTGASGAVILSGTTEPTTMGKIGDYYLNKSNADLYGPKTAAGWGTPINLSGNANVVSSTWFNLKPWVYDPPFVYDDSKYARYEIPNPVLNAVGYSSLSEMLDKGGVLLVYFKRGSAYFQLPCTSTYGPQPIFFSYDVSVGDNAFLFRINSYNDFPIRDELLNIPNDASNKIRYVLIPAGIQITTSSLKNKSYDEVKTLLKLKD